MQVPKPTSLQREGAIMNLKDRFPKGSTVYTILRSVSRSGMIRSIGLLSIRPDPEGGELVIRHPNYAAALVLGLRDDQRNGGVRISGAGMDMGFEIVYRLGSVLYGDGYALKHRWL